METVTLDPKRVEAFLGKVVNDLGAAFGTTLAYIGDKLGLYKAMAFAGPLSSEEVAKRSGTHERYVREWLINQAAGGYIDYDPANKKYRLPDEHAMALTDESCNFNVAGGFQVINGMIKADERILENFLSGNGMHWGEHNHNLFSGTERFFRPSYLGNLIDHWLPSIEGIVTKLDEGVSVADIGCGHGASSIIMAKAFTNSHFTGFDNHAPSIERGTLLAASEELSRRLDFTVASAQNFNSGPYDFITFFDCLHDLGDPVAALQNCYRQLSDEGTIMAVEPMAGRKTEENFNPIGRIFSGASVLCCTPNALASGGFALGTVASDEAIEQVVRAAGFTKFRRSTETPFNRVFEIKK